MPFQVSRSEHNNNTLIHLSDNNRSTRISVIPRAGALLHEFSVPLNGSLFNIIENYPLNRPVQEQVTHYFRSVKLSPWVCRLANGRYNFNGKALQVGRMFTDGTALHGLLYDQAFNIVDEFADDASAFVQLRHHYTGYDPGYPFEYSCEVKYTLHPDNLLEVETVINNTGNEDIPIADGWHPYFRLGGQVNNWELCFNARAMVEFDDNLVPTGRLLPFDQFNHLRTIGSTTMDNCFVLDMATGQPACTLRNPANGIFVSLFPDSSYRYLQVFIPDHRESIAIENISSAPDCFNNQMGLLVLPPGHAKTFRVFYRAGVQENG
jgi:aldose 1-epimerase